MEDSWLNPDYVINSFVTLISAILLLLIIVPAIFAGLIYVILTVIARLQDLQRPARSDADSADE